MVPKAHRFNSLLQATLANRPAPPYRKDTQVHDPSAGRIALWLDLKAQGIGYDRPVDDLWSILVAEFKGFTVVPLNANVHATPDRIFEHIERWLAADSSRRILLLLDEADRFLEIDGSPRGSETGTLAEFGRAAKLKGLMEKTNRRFKVVFAGLHNVQRTTQLENHPLAHYGEPLCIGPLLKGADRRAACELVERPLAALGYRFESPDLVMRLVAQANYYPSLIQLYCSHLLQHVASKPQNGPPYVLTSRHLEELYESRELQRAIRDRLLWTLQLDERYEVLAYVIAWNYACDRDKGIIDGIPVSAIRQDAISCWPEEFEKIASERAFEVLLEEMVGLGVLRMASPGRYTLRSPNVLTLMGSFQDIEAALERKREPVTQFEASAFRSGIPGSAALRSCLTAQQESQLKSRSHSVFAVFGLPVSGLEEIRPSVERLFGANDIIDCSEIFDPAGFGRKLQELDKRAKDAYTLVLVPPLCPWTEAWVKEAIRKVEKLTSKSSFVSVLFVGDSRTTWQWTSSGQAAVQQITELGIRVLTLDAWKDSMVRQWLDDCGFQSSPEFRQHLKAITGFWSGLLYTLHSDLKSCAGGAQGREALLDELESRGWVAALDTFGLGPNGPVYALKALATLDTPATPEELAAVAEVSVSMASAAFAWADLLGLLRPHGAGRCDLDPILGRILRGAAS